jgi:hypothetical protein
MANQTFLTPPSPFTEEKVVIGKYGSPILEKVDKVVSNLVGNLSFRALKALDRLDSAITSNPTARVLMKVPADFKRDKPIVLDKRLVQDAVIKSMERQRQLTISARDMFFSFNYTENQLKKLEKELEFFKKKEKTPLVYQS